MTHYTPIKAVFVWYANAYIKGRWHKTVRLFFSFTHKKGIFGMEFDYHNVETMIKIWIMVTREELKSKALACVNEIINQRGGRSIAVHIKRKGKRTWNWNEYKQAIINDSNLYDGDKEVKGTNPIDEFKQQFVFNICDTLPNGIKIKRRQN